MILDNKNKRLRAAFHEAGHALVMWRTGLRVESVTIADEGRRGFVVGGRGYPGCSGVAVSAGGYRYGDLFVSLHDQQTRGVRYPAWAESCAEKVREEREKMRDSMAILFAGVLAEWLFFEVPLDELKTGGGRRDMRDIADFAEEYAASEPDIAVVEKMVSGAESEALALLVEWRELLACLALMVFEDGHVTSVAFENLIRKRTGPALEGIKPETV